MAGYARGSNPPNRNPGYALAGMSEDHEEGVAEFLERRKPRFKGR